MEARLIFLLLLASFSACNLSNAEQREAPTSRSVAPLPSPYEIDPAGKTIEARFPPPADYPRPPLPAAAFGTYLRGLPLKPHGTPVHYYDGREKANQSAAAAVIDLDVGKRDLQQCADAVIRLRAEYLWQRAAFDKIEFHFTNGFLAPYSKWRAGRRIRVAGNEVSWTAGGTPDHSYAAFRKYLDMIFAYAGTLSVAKELKPRALAEIQIGDVFIQGGSPGHAVIVVDLVEQDATGDKQVLLAQSYMPAQDIHVLARPGASSPWYPVSTLAGEFRTPEWRFSGGDLKRFGG